MVGRSVRPITVLPNLLTIANAFCGVLAISKGIDALALSVDEPALFYRKMETACLLVFLGMVFDALDGQVARFMGGSSQFGAELDSFSDALTFGAAPALLAKVLIEHDGPLAGYQGNPRLHFLAAAAFTLMALLRLARFNLETEADEESHRDFRGLPSPAAAGAVSATILVYLTLSRRELEVSDGSPTPLGWLMTRFPDLVIAFPSWFFAALAVYLPVLGLLMVSRVRYVHVVSALTRRSNFTALVGFVFAAMALFAAPVPFLFAAFNGFVGFGLLWHLARLWRRRRHAAARAAVETGADVEPGTGRESLP